ncbi:MAG: hypothetical protein PHT60_10015 [Acidiphilium sp.]|nr:hypothetical protein [Acidiphilium sp.]MDD4936098.1 hypothetical protein [Acidiphilium sp.]
MMPPTVFNATIALIIIIGALIGLSQVARRYGLAQIIQRRGQMSRTARCSKSCQVDRTRKLSIIELEGCRFAILTGGRSDQILMLSQSLPQEHM